MSLSRVRSRKETPGSARVWRCFASLLLVVMLLVACAGSGTQATPTVPAPATETTVAPDPSANPEATATAVPSSATATRAPTSTATLRPTPSATSTRRATSVSTGPTGTPIALSSTSELTRLGLPGASLPTLAVGGEGGRTIFAGGVGLLRSLDGGVTWGEARSPEVAPKITALAVAPSNPKVVYVGVSEGCGKAPKQPGYVSRDGGDGWRAIGDSILSLTVDPKDSGTVYIVDCEGLKRSTNSGQTWELLTAPKVVNGAKAIVGIAPSNTDHLYIAVMASAATMSIAHSADRGVTWKGITPKIAPDLDVDVVLQGGEKNVAGALPQAIAVDADNPEIALVSTTYGVFRTENAGATWIRLDGGLENTVPKEVLPAQRDGARINTALLADPFRPGDFWVGTGAEKLKGVGLYRTRNGGESWRKPTTGLEGKRIYALALGGTSRDRVLYIATDDGVWKLTEP